jgi:hypothetical protein
MLGYFLAKMIKQSGKKGKKLITFYLCLAIFVEVVMGLFFLNFHFRNWEVPAYL